MVSFLFIRTNEQRGQHDTYHRYPRTSMNLGALNPISDKRVVYGTKKKYIYTKWQGMQRALSRPHECIFSVLIAHLEAEILMTPP